MNTIFLQISDNYLYLNEVDSLPASLDSLLKNSYPTERLEFIVVDGGSNDGTCEYLKHRTAIDPSIHLHHNPKRITPSALNIGIKKSKGEIVLRADAHALYQPEYIINSVLRIISREADNVGGAITVKGKGDISSECIALAMNSLLGNGGVSYRGSNNKKKMYKAKPYMF